jgi:hypothetical protein
MRPKVIAAIVGVGALALPAVSLGGADPGTGDSHARGGYGQLVAKDSAKDNPAAAAARVTLSQFGTVNYRVTANPGDTKVSWGITSRCVKGSLIDYWPGPGDFKTTTKKAGFHGSIPIALADPDYCTFAVAAQTYKNDAGKRVTVKLFNK